jgi:hypothetical protein
VPPFWDTDETYHLARTILSPINLAAANSRLTPKPRVEFLAWLDQYRQCLAENGLNPEDCCIVGSSTLEALDVRQSTDIDFTLRKRIRDERFNAGARNLCANVDIVTEGYHQRSNGRIFTDDELIDHPGAHFRFRGLKFASVSVVRDRKDFSRRPKDLRDVELIDGSTARLFPPASRFEWQNTKLQDGHTK